MNSIQWTEKLEEILKKKLIEELTPDQIAEVERIIYNAMENAWSVGIDNGMPFHDSYMKK